MYFKFYSGHHCRFGHEFQEIELFHDGKVRYSNGSKYRYSTAAVHKNNENSTDKKTPSDSVIRREGMLNTIVLEELWRMVKESGIFEVDDEWWMRGDRDDGRSELIIRLNREEEDEINRSSIIHHPSSTTRHPSSTTRHPSSITLSTIKLRCQSDIDNSKDRNGLSVYYNLTNNILSLLLSLLSFHTKTKPI